MRTLVSALIALTLHACSGDEPATTESGEAANADTTMARNKDAGRVATSTTKPDSAEPSAPTAVTLADDLCGGDAYVPRGKQLEVLVLFDNSTSMILPAFLPNGEIKSLWDVAVAELRRFVEDESSVGISVALKYFGTECEPEAYERPDVPLGALPAHATLISESLANTLPLSETATRPALEGALRFVRQRAADTGDTARQVIILVTDGYPDELDCEDNTTQAVSRVAATGRPEISTYVFATVTGLLLDEIARSGGTEKTFLADLNHVGALSAALAGVRDEELAALPCEYELPAAYFDEVNDPDLVNLLRDQVSIPRMTQQDCASRGDGWYFDDAAAPHRILTCPDTCKQLKQAASVNVVLKCPTVLVI